MDILTEVEDVHKLAPKRLRIGAALTDFVILMFAWYFIAKFSGQTYSQNGSIGFHLSGFPSFIAFFVAFLLLPINEGLTGQTFGKRLFKIQVVKTDYTKAALGNTIARHLFDGIDCFFLAGLIVASVNPNKQRIGDLVAKTLVVMK